MKPLDALKDWKLPDLLAYEVGETEIGQSIYAFDDYVEVVWAGIIGPTPFLLYRALIRTWLNAGGGTCVVGTEPLREQLGVGRGQLRSSFMRLYSFGFVGAHPNPRVSGADWMVAEYVRPLSGKGLESRPRHVREIAERRRLSMLAAVD